MGHAWIIGRRGEKERKKERPTERDQGGFVIPRLPLFVLSLTAFLVRMLALATTTVQWMDGWMDGPTAGMRLFLRSMAWAWANQNSRCSQFSRHCVATCNAVEQSMDTYRFS